MRDVILAMPPPGPFYAGIGFALLAVTAVILFALRRTAKNPERSRRRLAAFASLSGPFAGAAIGGLAIAFGEVHSLDRGRLFLGITGVGTIAGLLTGGLLALLAFRANGSDAS